MDCTHPDIGHPVIPKYDSNSIMWEEKWVEMSTPPYPSHNITDLFNPDVAISAYVKYIDVSVLTTAVVRNQIFAEIKRGFFVNRSYLAALYGLPWIVRCTREKIKWCMSSSTVVFYFHPNSQPRWLSGLMRCRVHSLWLLVDHCVLRNWESNPGQGSKGINFSGWHGLDMSVTVTKRR